MDAPAQKPLSGLRHAVCAADQTNGGGIRAIERPEAAGHRLQLHHDLRDPLREDLQRRNHELSQQKRRARQRRIAQQIEQHA